MIIKAKFLRNGVPAGNDYSYDGVAKGVGDDHGCEEHNHCDYETPHAVVPQVHSSCHI